MTFTRTQTPWDPTLTIDPDSKAMPLRISVDEKDPGYWPYVLYRMNTQQDLRVFSNDQEMSMVTTADRHEGWIKLCEEDERGRLRLLDENTIFENVLRGRVRFEV